MISFDDKVKFLRTTPLFKVVPLAEVRAIAFVAKDEGEIFLGEQNGIKLFVNHDDAAKLLREYPDLEARLDSARQAKLK